MDDPSVSPVEHSGASESAAEAPEPRTKRQAISGRALLGDALQLILWIAVADFLIFRHATFLAWGLQFLWVVVFFVATIRLRTNRPLASASVVTSLLLVAMGLKLVWCGSWWQVTCGILLVPALAMSLSGASPFLPELFGFLANAMVGGIDHALRLCFGMIRKQGDAAESSSRAVFTAAVLIPVATVLCFSVLFVLANPGIAEACREWLTSGWTQFSQFVAKLDVLELIFWGASAWLLLGLSYPAGKWALEEVRSLSPQDLPEKSLLFSAYRNTLWSVIVLFAIYLVFEWITLGMRDFPENFYYAGYAHQGAFWLTVALALSTAVLTVIFSRTTQLDPRVPSLKRLACVWSVCNFLLSLAVYNRLLIYVDFNGLTRLRIVGFLGISCVVVGFALVLIKILKGHGTVWLFHRQAWIPILAMFVYCALPVDWVVNRYNVSQIQEGNLAPSTQIVAQLTSAEGVLPWFDLVDHPDESIREGVRAILAIWAVERQLFESEDSSNQLAWTSPLGHCSPWISVQPGFSDYDRSRNSMRQSSQVDGIQSFASRFEFQWSERLLEQALTKHQAKWLSYAESPNDRDITINAFFAYAYQWY